MSQLGEQGSAGAKVDLSELGPHTYTHTQRGQAVSDASPELV